MIHFLPAPAESIACRKPVDRKSWTYEAQKVTCRECLEWLRRREQRQRRLAQEAIKRGD